MIIHSRDAIYRRIGGGKACSFDESAAFPLLLIEERGEKTLVALDAQATLNLFAFLEGRREQLSQLLEAANEPSTNRQCPDLPHADPSGHC